MADNNQSIYIRPASSEDSRFITNSWVNSFRLENFYIPKDIYRMRQLKVIEKILRGGAKTLVACPTDDYNQILGWICYEHLGKDVVIHYIYIKDTYREMGLAKLLLKKAGVSPTANRLLISHSTYILRPIHKKTGIIYIQLPHYTCDCN